MNGSVKRPKMDGIQVLPNPTKSLNDVKDYKCIKLPNGLMALLVSDTSYDLDKLDHEEQELEENKVAEDGDDENDDDDDESAESDDEQSEMSEEENEEGPKKKIAENSSGLKKSAAGLCIGMGSFSDLDDLPGKRNVDEARKEKIISFTYSK